nr:hypothetical protein BaRGS_030356 [Batillaria attramentaria]
MYGLLLEAIMDNISRTYGEAAWDEIRRRAGVRNTCFSTHETYSEQTIPRIAAAASEVTGVPENDIMDGFGVAFVNFVSQYGYGNMLKVLGRHMRDFLNGLDNLHEYLRFSYPKLRPPSFFVENENKGGLTLRYRSRRKGYVHYVKGQIRQVGEVFYNTKVVIHVINEGTDPVDNSIDVTFRLLFDNIGFKDTYKTEYDSIIDKIPLRSELLFELFPFHVVFGKQLQIRSVGSALSAVIPDAVGRQLPEVFYLARPITQLTWEMVRNVNIVRAGGRESFEKNNNNNRYEQYPS